MKRNRFEIAGQALLLATGVILSVVLISIMVAQFEQAKGMSDAVSENMLATTERIKNSDIMQYDGLRVSGAEVRNFLKLHTTGNGAVGTDSVVIDNGNGSIVYEDNEKYGEVTDPSAGAYIAPSQVYICEVEQNANGIITAVTFTIEKQ